MCPVYFTYFAYFAYYIYVTYSLSAINQQTVVMVVGSGTNNWAQSWGASNIGNKH